MLWAKKKISKGRIGNFCRGGSAPIKISFEGSDLRLSSILEKSNKILRKRKLMKNLNAAILVTLLSFSAFASRPLKEVKDVDLVKEVLRRGLSIDAAKLANLSSTCRGSNLVLSVSNESVAGSNQVLVHMVSGVRECEANLAVLKTKNAEFYESLTVNVCLGSALRTYGVDSNLNIVLLESKYVGLSQCLPLAQELNRHQD